MHLLDEEVFAVLLAIVVVGCVLGIAQLLRPAVVEPFTALGILNEECRIGDYPSKVFPGQNLTLCLYIYNGMGYPILARVDYKIANSSAIPTNTMPSPRRAVKSFTFIVDSGWNVTKRISVPIEMERELRTTNATLVFELWLYDIDRDEWIYSGRWTHIHVGVVRLPIP